MEILIFLIPIVTVGILAFKFREKTALWEYVVVLVPSVLLFFTLKYSFVYISSLDKEYLSDLVSKITYYEDWDETVMVTHTRTVSCGNGKTRTETYVVPERRYHPKRYVYETVTGETNDVSEDEYKLICYKLNMPAVFKDMHRSYRSKDGDAYVTSWNRTRENSYPVTWTHLYQNKVKASSYSIFKYGNISEEEIKENKLFDYPEIKNNDQNPILGFNATDTDIDAVRYLNGYRGPKNQIHVFILCFNNPSLEVAEMQKAYWQGGNKNEFVVCLGVKNNTVIWCNPFSWSDEPMLEVKTRDYFIKHPDINFKDYAEWLDTQIDKNWHRKEFNDFNYLSIELSIGWYIAILLIILCYNVGISYWVITNEFTLDKPNGIYGRYY